MASKKRKLPTWVTTVTPLSKTIALFLFIILPIVAFYFGIQYQKALDDVNRNPVLIMRSVSPMPSVAPSQLNIKR